MKHVWVRGKVYRGVWWGKRLFGRPRRRWEDNIKIYLQKIGCGGMDWIYLRRMTG
jgi:hypothetical protein